MGPLGFEDGTPQDSNMGPPMIRTWDLGTPHARIRIWDLVTPQDYILGPLGLEVGVCLKKKKHIRPSLLE